MQYKKIKQKIKGKTYDLYVANTPKKRKIGLKNIQIKKNQGMIFIYEKEREDLSFTMKGVKQKLRIIFFNKNEEVVYQEIGYPNQTKSIKSEGEPVKYVIEILA